MPATDGELTPSNRKVAALSDGASGSLVVWVQTLSTWRTVGYWLATWAERNPLFEGAQKAQGKQGEGANEGVNDYV